MTHIGNVLTIVLATFSLSACSNELKGELSVDGKAFVLDSCRSGQVYGFAGVEVVSKESAKLRIMQAPTGEAVAYYIGAGETTGVELGKCGSFSFSPQNSTINDVKNVEGKGDLQCEAAGHSVKGSFSFSNCH